MLFLLLSFSFSAQAENYVLKEPICFPITNEEDRTVNGDIETALDPNNGERQRSAFRLEPGEKAAICTVGPFYEGYRVKLTIRTLLPLFECKTKVGEPIVIKRQKLRDGEYKKNERGFTIWAECY